MLILFQIFTFHVHPEWNIFLILNSILLGSCFWSILFLAFRQTRVEGEERYVHYFKMKQNNCCLHYLLFDPVKYFSPYPSNSSPRAYFRHLLHVVTTCNSLFAFVLVFSFAKNFKFACCLAGFHLWFALNLLQYVLFWWYRMHALPFKNMPSPQGSN